MASFHEIGEKLFLLPFLHVEYFTLLLLFLAQRYLIL